MPPFRRERRCVIELAVPGLQLAPGDLVRRDRLVEERLAIHLMVVALGNVERVTGEAGERPSRALVDREVSELGPARDVELALVAARVVRGVDDDLEAGESALDEQRAVRERRRRDGIRRVRA